MAITTARRVEKKPFSPKPDRSKYFCVSISTPYKSAFGALAKLVMTELSSKLENDSIGLSIRLK